MSFSSIFSIYDYVKSINVSALDSDKKYPMIRVPRKQTYRYNAQYDIPEIEVVNLDQTKVELKFRKDIRELNVPDSISRMSGTVISSRKHKKRELGVFNKKTMLHDLTFSHWTDTTDVKIKDFLPLKSGGKYSLENRTPDMIIQDGRNLVIVEFATTTSESLKNIDLAYTKKMNMLLSTIKSLFDYSKEEEVKETYEKYDHIVILVVCVSPLYCVTNIEMLNSIYSDELCFKLRVLLEAFPITGTPYIKSEEQHQLFSYLSSLDKPKSEEFNIDAPNNYTELILRKSVEESVKVIKKNRSVNRRVKHMDMAVEKLHKQVNEENVGGFNLTKKNVVNLPFIVSTDDSKQYGLEFLESIDVDSLSNETEPVAKLFYTSIMWGKNNIVNTPIDKKNYYEQEFANDGQLLEEIDDLEFLGRKFSEQRSSYNRFRYSMEEPDLFELSKTGFGAKARKKELKEHKEEKKKGFSLLTDISDIDYFFSSNLSEHFESGDSIDLVDQSVSYLIEEAMSVHKSKFKEKTMVYLRAFLRTNYYKMMSLISDIATEVCISFRQNCRKNEVVIKKLMRHNVYLLIKPTKLSSQCFFSVFYKKSGCVEYNYDGVFRKGYENNDWIWTQFLSMNEGKAENLCSAEARAIQLYYYYLDFYKLSPIIESKDQDKVMLSRAHRMIFLSTLFLLSDKKETEEISSLSRYIAMEGFVAAPVYPQPWKMISKFPTLYRSRFSVFILNRLVNYSYDLIRNPCKLKLSEMTVDERSTLRGSFAMNHKWTDMKNPFFLDEFLSNPGQLLNIMYVGYAVNKNQKVEDNAASKILKKIVDCEVEFQAIRDKFYSFNKEIMDKTRHTFNSSYLNHIVNVVKNEYLIKKHGRDWEKMIQTRILEEVSSTNIEDVLLTLKASSNFKKENEQYNPEIRYSRRKVVEASNELLNKLEGENTKIIDILPYCLDYCEKRGSVETDIFSKMQHSGPREIYVLTIESRVVQWVIERISRVLCDLFEGETMVHPKNKTKLPLTHNAECLKTFKGSRSVTYCVSADASKWSQTQHFSKFVMILKKFLPKYWHNFIERSLSLWQSKKIMIPDSLLKLFSRDTESPMKFSDDYMNEIYRGFRGIEKSRLIKEGRSYIEIESGMMQGILHYTSSFFHSVVNAYIEVEGKKWMKKHTKRDVVITLMQSSDDSCMIISFRSEENPKLDNKTTILTYSLMKFKELVGDMMGLTTSIEKTTSFTPYLFEFNSNFFFGAAHYEPDYKSSLATLVIPERESLVERQEQMYNSLTTHISMGGSFFSTFHHQIAQAFLHYKMLGSSTTFRFKLLCDALLIIKDPSLGFFVMDNPIACGLTSYTYCLWKLCTNSSFSINIKYCIDLLKKGTVGVGSKNVSLEVTNHGIVTRTKMISFLRREKHEKMIQRMNLTDEWLEEFDRNPEILFRKAETKPELVLKICSKMNQPGVIESLSTGNTVARQIAFSSYCLQSRILNDRSILNSSEESYTTMLESVKRSCQMVINANKASKIESSDLKYLFPYHEDYLMLSSVLQSSEYTVTRSVIDHRRTQTTVEVLEGDDFSRRPLIDVMRQRWFDKLDTLDRTHTMESNEESFQEYKKMLPWLRDTIQETVEESPFEHTYHLKNWMEQFKNDKRAIKISGASLYHKHGVTGLSSVLRMNFLRGYRLMVTNQSMLVNEDEMFHDTGAVDSVLERKSKQEALTALCCILSAFGKTNEEKARLVRDYFEEVSSSTQFNFKESRSRSSSNGLSILSHAIIEGSGEQLFGKIKKTKEGCLGYYVKRQKFDKDGGGYYGEGIWRGNISGVDVEIHVNNYKGQQPTCEKILIERKKDSLKSLEFGLSRWFKEHHIEPRFMSSGRPDSHVHFNVSISPTFYFSGKNLTADNDRTPVFIVGRLERVAYLGGAIDIEVSRMTIRIVHVAKFGNVSYKNTIFSFTVRSQHYDEDLVIRPFKTTNPISSMTSRWLQNRKLTVGEANGLLKHVINEVSDQTLRSEFRLFLKSKLIFATIFPLIESSSNFLNMSFEEEQEEVEEVDDLDIEALMLEMAEDDGELEYVTADLCQEIQDIEESIDADIDLFQDPDMFEFSEAFEMHNSTVDDVRAKHKFFDNYINNMLKRAPKIAPNDAQILSLRTLFRKNEANALVKEYIDLAEFVCQKQVTLEQSEVFEYYEDPIGF